MEDKLTQLKKMTVVVADTGDIDSIRQYQPEDATTNPSLLFKAARMTQYSHLVDDAINLGKTSGKNGQDLLDTILDQLAVNFGKEILEIVPGRISTEVDARLSFDREGTIERARKLMDLYEQAGIERHRILIKIASTWEEAGKKEEAIKAFQQVCKQLGASVGNHRKRTSHGHGRILSVQGPSPGSG